jgi:hypothetical protein
VEEACATVEQALASECAARGVAGTPYLSYRVTPSRRREESAAVPAEAGPELARRETRRRSKQRLRHRQRRLRRLTTRRHHLPSGKDYSGPWSFPVM